MSEEKREHAPVDDTENDDTQRSRRAGPQLWRQASSKIHLSYFFILYTKLVPSEAMENYKKQNVPRFGC
jgi:hypothetical protein